MSHQYQNDGKTNTGSIQCSADAVHTINLMVKLLSLDKNRIDSLLEGETVINNQC